MGSEIEVWKTWEGRVVDAKFPLRQWLGGSDHSAFFLTGVNGASPRKAAIKLLPTVGMSSADEEAQLSLWSRTTKLSHPNLLQLLDFGRSDLDGERFLYAVIEYADEDLGQILPERLLTIEEVALMLPPVCEGLTYLHQSGFVHGSLKPANVSAVGNQLKISVDCLRDAGKPAAGKLGVYDAPESSRALTAASDVWSLGALLVTVLTQHEPHAQADGSVAIPAAVPEPFSTICRRCLSINPQRRPTIAEISGKPTAASPAIPLEQETRAPVVEERVIERGVRELTPPEKKSKRWMILAILVALALIGALLGRKLMSGPSENSSTSALAPAASNPPPAEPLPEIKAPVKTGTVRGSVLHRVSPDVSQQARNTIRGRVKINVQVSVDASGNVSDASVALPVPSQYFAKQARAAALAWKFNAPQVNGQPTSSTWMLHFQFSRSSTQESATESLR
jgi:TonB family protein